jgi:7,8-dihydropterin-6-yl-methyl-4-(beta-D-ribofuranosyl)aminobenzene 5'-phosphate synthase
MEIRLTTLSENTATHGYIGEWGLSILVEVDKTKILMDTGLSFSAAYNAQQMGIDLSTVDYIVLSHGHTDHTGGLRDILKLTGEVEVIAHPGIFAPKYVRRSQDAPAQHSGLPFTRDELESCGAKFTLSQEPVRILKHIMTTGEIPMITPYEKLGDNMFVKENGVLRPDKLEDDLALVIDADFGLVVVLGCAHKGIINTLHHAQTFTGKDFIYSAVGGTHLIRSSDERIDRTIDDLKSIGIQRLGVSHCTGFHASIKLAQAFEGTFIVNNAGTRLVFPQTE